MSKADFRLHFIDRGQAVQYLDLKLAPSNPAKAVVVGSNPDAGEMYDRFQGREIDLELVEQGQKTTFLGWKISSLERIEEVQP